jgi:hypothetical protein
VRTRQGLAPLLACPCARRSVDRHRWRCVSLETEERRATHGRPPPCVNSGALSENRFRQSVANHLAQDCECRLRSCEGPRGVLGKPYEPNAVIKNDIEFILMQRKPGGYRSPSVATRVLSVISAENHRAWFQQIWTGLTGASTKDHPAPYPLELAQRLIRMFSFCRRHGTGPLRRHRNDHPGRLEARAPQHQR